MGEGILKERVPEAHTDYVIAIISEEYGLYSFNDDNINFFIYFF